MIPKYLNDTTIKQILKDAEKRYPEESCGVVVVTPGGTEKYVACENISKSNKDQFVISPESLAGAEDIGEIVGIVHSHPDGTTVPSEHDIAVMQHNREIELMIDPESVAIPWHIVSWPDGDYRQITPKAPDSLLDRPFVHGVWDCWATCEAYYNKYHGIKFPTYEREDLWWEKEDSVSFYEAFYEAAGFYQVDVGDIKVGDLVVMQVGRTHYPNHAGVFLGDVGEFEGKEFVGNSLMLHHMYGKLSEVIVYGGQWLHRTRMVLRHKDVR